MRTAVAELGWQESFFCTPRMSRMMMATVVLRRCRGVGCPARHAGWLAGSACMSAGAQMVIFELWAIAITSDSGGDGSVGVEIRGQRTASFGCR